jgi:hypothetical protein
VRVCLAACCEDMELHAAVGEAYSNREGPDGAVSRRKLVSGWLIAGRTVWQEIMMGHTGEAPTCVWPGPGAHACPLTCWAGPQAVAW